MLIQFQLYLFHYICSCEFLFGNWTPIYYIIRAFRASRLLNIYYEVGVNDVLR